jgi:hypothetical protein
VIQIPQPTFDRASTEISDAVKAIDERNKNKPKAKTMASKAEQKEDPKAKADDKPRQDETLPLWWTNPSVPPPSMVHSEPPPGCMSPMLDSRTPGNNETRRIWHSDG